MRWRRVFVASFAAAVLIAAFPANAAGSSGSFAVMFSDSGDWIGGGSQRLFRSGNSSITMGGTPGYVSVEVSGGTFGDYYTMDFAAPPGARLSPGYFGSESRRRATPLSSRRSPSAGRRATSRVRPRPCP